MIPFLIYFQSGITFPLVALDKICTNLMSHQLNVDVEHPIIDPIGSLVATLRIIFGPCVLTGG